MIRFIGQLWAAPLVLLGTMALLRRRLARR